MAYEIHITRRNSSGQRAPIPMSEWKEVVEQTKGVRMAKGDFEATNPTTAEAIRIANSGGDVEVYFSADEARRRVFRWSSLGRISFHAPSDFELPTSVVRCLAAELARALNASLIGDEGEIYE